MLIRFDGYGKGTRGTWGEARPSTDFRFAAGVGTLCPAMLYGTTLAISDEAWPWVMAVLGIATIFYAVFRPMLRKKRDALDRPANFRPSQQRTVENEMQNLLVELSKMAQQVSAQLDTRAAKLEMLIDDADRKIAELQAVASQIGRAHV